MNAELLQRLLSLLDEMSDLLAKDKTPDGGDHFLQESFADSDTYYQYIAKDHEFIHLLAQYNKNYVDYLSNVMWTGASMETDIRESYSLLADEIAVD